MNCPPPTAPFESIKYWMESEMLTPNHPFGKQALNNILLRVRNGEGELVRLMVAINSKNRDTLCAMAGIAEQQKRVAVNVLGKSTRVYAPTLMYKIFRHSGATKKSMSKICENEGDGEICVNPYHYQLVDRNGEDVADQLSDAAQREKDMLLQFPVVDINDLPDRKLVKQVEDEEVDESDFISGAAGVMSSTLKPNCPNCKALREELEAMKVLMAEKDRRIAELEAPEKQELKLTAHVTELEAPEKQPSRQAKKK